MGLFTPRLSNKKYNRFMRMGSKRASRYFAGRRKAKDIAVYRNYTKMHGGTMKKIMGAFGF